MKFYTLFLVKGLFIVLVLMQLTLAVGKKHCIMEYDIAGPMNLTLCGLGLLYLGFRKKTL